MFHFKQFINEHTRVCHTSTSTIDNIIVSDVDKIFQSGVLSTCFSDHFTIYCTRKVTKNYVDKHNIFKARAMKNYNKDDFQQSLLAVDWSPVLLCDCVSEAWNLFKSIFLNDVGNIAPVRGMCIKQRTETWIRTL
jgi:hypothetical protein